MSKHIPSSFWMSDYPPLPAKVLSRACVEKCILCILCEPLLLNCCQHYLMIPLNNFQAHTIRRELRTEQSTVPDDALSKASSLFTREVLIFVYYIKV